MDFQQVAGIIFTGLLAFFVIVMVTSFYGSIVRFDSHKAFCVSVGLEFDGYANYRGSNINCSGFSGGVGVIKTFMYRAGEYFEVSS